MEAQGAAGGDDGHQLFLTRQEEQPAAMMTTKQPLTMQEEEQPAAMTATKLPLTMQEEQEEQPAAMMAAQLPLTMQEEQPAAMMATSCPLPCRESSRLSQGRARHSHTSHPLAHSALAHASAYLPSAGA